MKLWKLIEEMPSLLSYLKEFDNKHINESFVVFLYIVYFFFITKGIRKVEYICKYIG